MKNLAEIVSPNTEKDQKIDKFFPFGAVGFSVAEINSALTYHFGNTGVRIDRKDTPCIAVDRGVKNPVKKDYAPQFNKGVTPRSNAVREACKTLSIATIAAFGTYIILGFMGLL